MKKDYWHDPIMAAKRATIKEWYMPENLRGKIKVCIKKNGEVAIKTIKQKMKKITAKNLLKLGFKRENNVPTDERDTKFHYYVYEVSDKCLLISCSNDEKIKGGYEIELYEIEEIKFRSLKKVKKLIKILESGTK